MKAHPSGEHGEAPQGPAPKAGPAPHRDQQCVEGNGLMLDLLDRVPAPHALRLRVSPGKVSRIGQYGIGQRRGEMFEGARPRKLHERRTARSEEHTSELQSLMRTSYAVLCL